MVKVSTLVLGATMGLAALGVSNAASAAVHVAVGIGLPVVAPPVVAAAVVAPPAVVAAPVVYPRVGYYGPHFYPYPRVVVGWHPGYVAHRGYYGWRR